MTVPGDDAEYAVWLRYATEDLAAARSIVEQKESPRVASYLSQQAAEKAFKAVIVLCGHRIPRVHDLVELRATAGSAIASALDDAALGWLTDWYVRERYPGDVLDARAGDADRALAIAETIHTDVVRLVREQETT